MSEDLQDPFLVHNNLRTEGQTPELKDKFEGGEHLWLGSQGARKFANGNKTILDLLRGLRRPRDGTVLSYGELVALSGDFYGKPEELFLEEKAWLPEWKGSNDLGTLRDAFKNELDWIKRDQRHSKAGYPDNTLTFVWTAKSYVELAENNTDHFGWHNIKRYCDCHARAIDYAIQAHGKGDADPLWLRALFYNGFADHFLTDGFAAGHIRVPRQQIREWAPSQGYSGKLAGLLSKLLHDQDGHMKGWHVHGENPLDATEGLPVENSNGRAWLARCDGQLFLPETSKTDLVITEPVNAVAESLREVFNARDSKEVPQGQYAALKYVPFPRPGSQTLAQKFSDTSSAHLEELLESCAWYTKLTELKLFTDASLDAANVMALFKALPELMASFRASVKADCASDPKLLSRLPERYIQAFEQIG